MKNKCIKVLLDGIVFQNPVLILLLGTCPTLATTSTASDAVGMGVATLFVLVMSNIVISLLRNIIPKTYRIPCFIVVIAGFVTIVEMLVNAFLLPLAESLGVFLPLIVVNCIILGRAEVFASKNSVFMSAVDGLGMGLGFTGALFIIGSIREILGAGTFFGIEILNTEPIGMLALAPGGFLVFGLVIAAVNALSKKDNNSNNDKQVCAGCPSRSICNKFDNTNS